MKNLKLVKLFVITFLINLGCYTGAPFQDGRSLSKDESEITLGCMVGVVPPIVNLEGSYKYGISNNFDAGFRLNTGANFALTTKYQIIGTKSSKFAAALGLNTIVGVTYANEDDYGIGFALPIYFSKLTLKKNSIYFNPTLTYYINTTDYTKKRPNIFGFEINVGTIFPGKNDIAVDLHFHSRGQFSFGFARKFRYNKKTITE